VDAGREQGLPRAQIKLAEMYTGEPAEPGGICVSRFVRDQVRDRLDYTFEDLGEQQVKNGVLAACRT
jgi:hypothetical protein